MIDEMPGIRDTINNSDMKPLCRRIDDMKPLCRRIDDMYPE